MRHNRVITPLAANDAHGPPIATSDPSSMDDDAIALIKEYALPNFVTANDADDKKTVTRIDLAFIQRDLKLVKDRCARLEREIQDEIKMLTEALNGGKETRDQVKRRISRLAGALKYPGVIILAWYFLFMGNEHTAPHLFGPFADKPMCEYARAHLGNTESCFEWKSL